MFEATTWAPTAYHQFNVTLVTCVCTLLSEQSVIIINVIIVFVTTMVVIIDNLTQRHQNAPILQCSPIQLQ